MEVRMIRKIQGSRDGLMWPEVGETIDVPKDEGEQLVANDYAEVADGRTGPRSKKDAANDQDAPSTADGDSKPAK